MQTEVIDHPPVQPSAFARCRWCGLDLSLQGAAQGTRFAGRVEWRPVRCQRCGVATTSPWPTAADLDAAYAGSYRPTSGRFSGCGDAALRWSRGRLARRVDQSAPVGRVLDVGCGDGTLLDALARTGRCAQGLERSSGRPDVSAADISEVDGRWAAVVFWHSLEHLPQPRTALHQACQLLGEDGLLVVAIPNAASLQARVFGDRWFGLDLPRHLVHLPASSLVRAVQEEGLRVRRVSYLRGGQEVFGWLHGLVAALPGRPHLYDAIRQPTARQTPVSPVRRLLTLAAGAGLLPLAVAAALVEVAVRRGGTVYLEAVGV